MRFQASRPPVKLLLAVTALVACALLVQACATMDRRCVATVGHLRNHFPAPMAEATDTLATVSVMTLNMAHSRGDGVHQLLQGSRTARRNLDAILEVLDRHQPDVIALQEADIRSFWNGRFDHVEYVAENGGYRHSLSGDHAGRVGLSYGTALVSKMALENPATVTFDPTSSMTPKGFVVSTLQWPDPPHLRVDVISVHLDFASKSNRRKQVAELVAFLRGRQLPLIIMGDMNAEWGAAGTAVRHLARELGLKAYEPTETGMETFAGVRDRRLDWILVSPHFDFRCYEVLPEVVSDHRAVIAELVLAEPVVAAGLVGRAMDSNPPG